MHRPFTPPYLTGPPLNFADRLPGTPISVCSPGGALVQVISAFDVPRILYDPIRKSFYRAPAPTSLLGTAQARPSARFQGT